MESTARIALFVRGFVEGVLAPATVFGALFGTTIVRADPFHGIVHKSYLDDIVAISQDFDVAIRTVKDEQAQQKKEAVDS